MTIVKTPLVLWAQQSSATTKQKNFIYLTINLQGIIHSTLKYIVTDATISFKVNAKEGDEQCEYAFELDFYAEVVPELLEKRRTPQSVTIVIFKKEITAMDWPQLSKIELAYVKTDFSQWSGEGDECDVVDEDGSTDIIDVDMDSSSTGIENGEPLILSNQGTAPPRIKTPTTPQISWTQQSSATESMKNFICISVYAQDIAESTLKCIVTDTTISFRAYAREKYEEREYAVDLDLYAEVIPEAVERDLTEQCLTITLLKKLMDTQYWPRLQKAEGVLPYIRIDIKGWVGDESDDNISAKTEIHSLEENNERDLMKAGDFNGRGIFFLRRFERLAATRDIEKSISNFEDAVRLTPDGHPKKAGRLSNLGCSLARRFESLGEMGDVEKSISNQQYAVRLTSSTANLSDLPGLLNNLGNSYLCRFERTGNLEDIDCAISHHQKAVECTPSGHIDLLERFTNLGNSYLCRFEHTVDLEDINFAISYHQKAVESTSSGHPYLTLFNNLGTSYSCRFQCTGDLEDIDFAISYLQKAVYSTPGHADLPFGYNNLGNSYGRRFKCTGDLKDIDCAIYYLQKAVKSIPSGHANLPILFKNLGQLYASRFKHNHCIPDVHQSIASYRQGAKANGTPSICLTSAKNAAILSSVHDSTQCLIDFGLFISLLSEVAGLEQTIHRRHANLHGHSDFLGSAVAAALDFNRLDLAIEWFEQGRCLVWNQINQLRTPIDNLRTKSPSLADHFTKVASALESYGTRSISSIPSSHETHAEDIRLQDDTRNHTLHAAEYKQLLEEIRGLPDFNDFLRPPKAVNLLSSLPPDGPVIIFNIHNTRCDALALIATIEGPLHIPLKDFSLAQAEELQQTLQLNILEQRKVEDRERAACNFFDNPAPMSFILQELWHKIVQPILVALGYLVKVPPNPLNRSRIWWCPTGPLAFLPLHAAGIYGSAYLPGSCVSDFVVSSYTPTIRSINDKFTTSSTSSRSTNLLLISQPNTPGLKSIPSTRKETYALETLMKGTAVNPLLLEDCKATIEKVKTEMNSHGWAHFACHGVQDVHQPLESGLCLHDGRLGLIEIMKQRIPNPDLVFLSACQTSKGDLELSEEVVHLAAGMLAAGYRGVVGTMWSISDLHGPHFAMEFYQYLLRESGSEGLNSTRAAHALDYATRTVRETLGEDNTAFLTWVPYVHFGY